MKYHKLHVSLAINLDIYDVNDNSGYAVQNVGNQVFVGHEFSLFFVVFWGNFLFSVFILYCTCIIIKLYELTYNKTILMGNTL